MLLNGERIKELRLARKWSMRQLAKVATDCNPEGSPPITLNAVNNMERGRVASSNYWYVVGVARALGVHPEDLFTAAKA